CGRGECAGQGGGRPGGGPPRRPAAGPPPPRRRQHPRRGTEPMSPAEWIRALGDRDPSVAIALAAIARAAEASDVVMFGDLVMAYREAHIAAYRALPGPGQTGVTSAEVRGQRTTSGLPRLPTAG